MLNHSPDCGVYDGLVCTCEKSMTRDPKDADHEYCQAKISDLKSQLRGIIKERDELKTRCEELTEERDSLEGRLNCRRAERDALQTRCERYEKALRWYADEHHWQALLADRRGCLIDDDRGEKARQALEGK